MPSTALHTRSPVLSSATSGEGARTYYDPDTYDTTEVLNDNPGTTLDGTQVEPVPGLPSLEKFQEDIRPTSEAIQQLEPEKFYNAEPLEDGEDPSQYDPHEVRRRALERIGRTENITPKQTLQGAQGLQQANAQRRDQLQARERQLQDISPELRSPQWGKDLHRTQLLVGLTNQADKMLSGIVNGLGAITWATGSYVWDIVKAKNTKFGTYINNFVGFYVTVVGAPITAGIIAHDLVYGKPKSEKKAAAVAEEEVDTGINPHEVFRQEDDKFWESTLTAGGNEDLILK